jgi:hypothetical protein
MRSMALRVGPFILLGAGVAAADPCFCLQDTADRLWYDCIEYRKGPGPDPFFDCLPSTRAREREPVAKGHTLTRIPDGQAPCRPCREASLDARNTMRPLTPKPGPSGATPGTGHD